VAEKTKKKALPVGLVKKVGQSSVITGQQCTMTMLDVKVM
jgi:hypothetical protein